MKLEIFQIPATEPARALESCNQFLSSHKVVQIEKHFVANGVDSFWSVCVTWVEGAAPVQAASVAKSKVDYKQVLSDAEFSSFVRLRELRKQLAERDGVPPYQVFTNEQLAAHADSLHWRRANLRLHPPLEV